MVYVVPCLLLVSFAWSSYAVALDVHESLQTQSGRIEDRGENPTFMIVGGISAGQEMCLSVENGNVNAEGSEVVLEPCIDTVAAGDGRELWQFGSNDQIVNILGGKCMGLKENVVADGGHVVLVNCDAAAGSKDGRSQWTLEANNQLMSGHPGQYCLSQRGASPGVENVAAKAAVMASSSVDSVAHGNDVFICNSTLSWLTFTSSQGRIWPLMASMELTGPVNLILMSPLRLRLTWVDTTNYNLHRYHGSSLPNPSIS